MTDIKQNGEPIGEANPPESAGPPGSGNSPPVKASPEPETLPAPVRAGGAPPVDLNAFVLDLDSSALNIDTSLRRIAGALEAGLSAVERIAAMAEAHELASRAQIAARAYVQMHQESDSERVANLARIDDAGSQPAWDSADDALRDAGACQRAARGRTAALLSLLEQVAAPKDANRAADPDEVGRPDGLVPPTAADLENAAGARAIGAVHALESVLQLLDEEKAKLLDGDPLHKGLDIAADIVKDWRVFEANS